LSKLGCPVESNIGPFVASVRPRAAARRLARVGTVGVVDCERHALVGDVMIALFLYPTVRSTSATVPVAGVRQGHRNNASADPACGSLPLWRRYQWAMSAEPEVDTEVFAPPEFSRCRPCGRARSLMTRCCRWRRGAMTRSYRWREGAHTRPRRSFPKHDPP